MVVFTKAYYGTAFCEQIYLLSLFRNTVCSQMPNETLFSYTFMKMLSMKRDYSIAFRLVTALSGLVLSSVTSPKKCSWRVRHSNPQIDIQTGRIGAVCRHDYTRQQLFTLAGVPLLQLERWCSPRVGRRQRD